METRQMTQPQIFNVPDRSIPSTYNRDEDLETVFVLGKGMQEQINRQLLLDAKTNKRNAELILAGLSSGKGFYVNEIKVTGP